MQKEKKAHIMVRLDPVIYEAFSRIAVKENRPVAAHARHVIHKYVETEASK